MSYRWLEHASELELRIEAPSEEAVFELAVAALGELIAADDTSAGDTASLTQTVAVAARDRAALLAAFLEELVYLIETEDLIPERVDGVELAEGKLASTVHGHRGRPRHVVKGITYHELAFKPVNDHFLATVVLDV